jgi:tetratricopeptide (TPR) repeat protein
MNGKELYEKATYMEKDGHLEKAKELFLEAGENRYYPGYIRIADLLKNEGKQEEAQSFYEKAYIHDSSLRVRLMLEDRGIYLNKSAPRRLGSSTVLSTLMQCLMSCMIIQIIINLLLFFYTLDKGSPIILLQVVVNIILLIFNICVFYHLGQFSISTEDYKSINDKKRKDLVDTIRKLEQRISDLENKSGSKGNQN